MTFADREGTAPLSIESALALRTSTEDVTFVAGEVDYIIEVEFRAIGPPVGRVTWVTTGDS